MCVPILTANTKSDLLANRRKPAFWVRGPRHRYQMGLEVVVIFKGSMNAGVLLNLTVRVSVFTSALQS